MRMGPPGTADVDVVIVAHNAGEILSESVASAVEQAGPRCVTVVDSGSTDGSVAGLGPIVSDVRVLITANNGFAAATNAGINQGRRPFVLLLNPDAILMPGAIDAMRRVVVTDDRVAIVGALVLNMDGTVQANAWGRFPSMRSLVSLRLWRGLQYLTGNRALSPRAPGVTSRVDWVTGAAMLVRRSAMDVVGGMDEGFFLYYEDVEWCHRFADRGWLVVLEPSAFVAHALGASGAPSASVRSAYRSSFYRYCDLYGLCWLKAAARVGLCVRGALGRS